MKTIIIIIVLLGLGFYFYNNMASNKRVPVTDLSIALSKARSESKNIFVLVGRENCKNCRTLRSYIDEGEVKVNEEQFVYVDLNCDDPKSLKEFESAFKAKGRELPVVVVADPYGRQFATRSGYGRPEEFTKLIDDAVAHMQRRY